MITHHKVSTFLIILQKLHASFYSHQRSHTNHPPIQLQDSSNFAQPSNRITVKPKSQQTVIRSLRFYGFRFFGTTAQPSTANRNYQQTVIRSLRFYGLRFFGTTA